MVTILIHICIIIEKKNILILSHKSLSCKLVKDIKEFSRFTYLGKHMAKIDYRKATCDNCIQVKKENEKLF